MSDTERVIKLSIDGQRFRLAGKVALNGFASGAFLAVARCANCGADFAHFATSARVSARNLLARCGRHRKTAGPAGLHPDAMEAPPAMSLADLQSMLAKQLAAAVQSNGIDEILLRSTKRGELTIRDALAAIGSKGPGMSAFESRLGISNSGVASAVKGLISGGWLERHGVGPGAKFVLTPAARSAARNSEAPAHVH